MEPPSGHARNSIGVVDSSGDVELTFLGYPFESLGRTFNSILTVITIGRKQPDHLVGAAGGRARDIAGSEVDSFSNGIFVLQRPLPSGKRQPCLWSRCTGRPKPPRSLYHSARRVGQLHPDIASARILQVFQCDKRVSAGRRSICRPCGSRRPSSKPCAGACHPDWRDPPPPEAVVPKLWRVDQPGY